MTMNEPAGFAEDPGAEAESLAPAVTRAAAILDLLAGNGSVPAGPSELARRLGLPKSSIANICGALADAGFVRRVGTGFTLGRKLAELGGAYLTSVDLVQEFHEACAELPTGAVETVQLAVLDGAEMTYRARHDGSQPVRHVVVARGGSSRLLAGRKDSRSRISARHSRSSSTAKCATPLVALCVIAPPSSSFVTSSCVTVLITSGPVTNM